MGNETEKMRIINEHEEEVARIEQMNEENERRYAIEKLAKENGFKLDMKRLDNLAEEARMRHEEVMKRINNEYLLNKDYLDNQKNKDDKDYLIKKQQLDNDLTIRKQEITEKAAKITY